MATDPKSSEPFVSQQDRPNVTADTPLSELRVRDLHQILAGAAQVKIIDKTNVDKTHKEFDKTHPDKHFKEFKEIEKIVHENQIGKILKDIHDIIPIPVPIPIPPIPDPIIHLQNSMDQLRNEVADLRAKIGK